MFVPQCVYRGHKSAFQILFLGHVFQVLVVNTPYLLSHPVDPIPRIIRRLYVATIQIIMKLGAEHLPLTRQACSI